MVGLWQRRRTWQHLIWINRPPVCLHAALVHCSAWPDSAQLSHPDFTQLYTVAALASPLLRWSPLNQRTDLSLFSPPLSRPPLLQLQLFPCGGKLNVADGGRRGPNSGITAVTEPPETRPMSRTLSHTYMHSFRHTHADKGIRRLCGVCEALVKQVTTTAFSLMVETWRTWGWK